MKNITSVLLPSVAASLMLFLPGSAKGQDTLRVKNPGEVVIVKTPTQQRVTIKGKEGDADYSYESVFEADSADAVFLASEHNMDFSLPFIKSRKPRVNRRAYVTGGPKNFFLGFSYAYDDPLWMRPQTMRSTEIGFDFINVDWTPRKGNSFDVSLGVQWKNFRTRADIPYATEDGHLSSSVLPLGADVKRARARAFSLRMPVLYTHSFQDAFGFSVGPVVQYNLRGSVLTKYRIDGQSKTYKSTDLDLNPVTVDLYGSLNFDDFCFYVKWSPMEVVKKDPSFKSLSFGFDIEF